MANQSQIEPTPNPKQSTKRVIAARIKVLRLLCRRGHGFVRSRWNRPCRYPRVKP